MEPLLDINRLQTVNGLIIESHDSTAENVFVRLRWRKLNLNSHSALRYARLSPLLKPLQGRQRRNQTFAYPPIIGHELG